MLARVLAMALCPCLSVSVCLSQVGVLSKGMNGLMCFWPGEFFSTSRTLSFKEIQVSTKIRVLPSGIFPKLRRRKFRHGISIVERAVNLARERWTLTA